MEDICKSQKVIEESTLSGGPARAFEGQYDSGFACGTGIPGATPGKGCGMKLKVDVQGKNATTGKWTTYAEVEYTGNPCTVGPAGPTLPTEATTSTPPVTATKAPCSPPQVQSTGTVNGASVSYCSAPGETKSEPKKEVKKDNIGTPDETTTEKQTSTTCDGQGCTTTTVITTKNSSGSVTGVTGSTNAEGKDGFCSKNPKDGNCTGTGSAGCSKGGGTAGCSELGTGTDGEMPTKEVEVGTPGKDNMNGFNIGNTCPADLDFTLWGKSFKVSLKPACDIAPFVKPIVLLMSALAALFIVYEALTTKNT